MHYLIDGYNLIFSLIDSKAKLQVLREETVLSLQKHFAKRKISGMIIFDGAHRRGEESGLSYPSPLIVAYTPQGESADAFIIEKLETKRKQPITVVTNDRGLQRQAKAKGAKILGNEEFIVWLYKKKKRATREIVESKTNIDRLEKVFEERFKDLP